MERTYTVTEFNKMVKSYLDDIDDFQEFFIEGEISNITYYKSGHLYFGMKDKKSQIKCVAFNYKLKRIPEDLKEGDLVKIFGDVGFYETRGDLQVLVRHLEKSNLLGQLFTKLEEVKAKMQKAGYFDDENKKQLPKFPRNIGVVTAISGAAIQDIIKTAKKRFPAVNIYVYPAKVQGIGSKEEIIKGIETLNKIEEIDLIIAGRGGGSIEDLWAFNEEEVAMAFFNSEKPIISAVGHEIDFLLTDLVADARAATPTQAIELSVPEQSAILQTLEAKKRYLKQLLHSYVKSLREQLKLRINNYYLKNFDELINDHRRKLINIEDNLNGVILNLLKDKKRRIENNVEKLIALNPINTLRRGYSVTKNKERSIKSIDDVMLEDEIVTVLENGKLISIVKEKIYEENNT